MSTHLLYLLKKKNTYDLEFNIKQKKKTVEIITELIE